MAGLRLVSCLPTFLLIVAPLLVGHSFSASASPSRQRRNIGQFGNMIFLTTEMEPLLFNDYGNHCGSGSDSRAVAVDNIDQNSCRDEGTAFGMTIHIENRSMPNHFLRCCREHDQCYDRMMFDTCSTPYLGPYFTFYSWSVNGDKITCDDSERCRLGTCTCDQVAALCLATYRSEYNTANKKPSIWDWLM